MYKSFKHESFKPISFIYKVFPWGSPKSPVLDGIVRAGLLIHKFDPQVKIFYRGKNL